MNLLSIPGGAGALSMKQVISDKNFQSFQGSWEQEVHITIGFEALGPQECVPLGTMLRTQQWLWG